MELLTMATHTLPSPHILDDDEPQAAALAHPRKPPLMRRLYIALLIAQHHRAQRHIDRVLGGRALEQAFRAPPPER
jgi:hypothetical protein